MAYRSVLVPGCQLQRPRGQNIEVVSLDVLEDSAAGRLSITLWGQQNDRARRLATIVFSSVSLARTLPGRCLRDALASIIHGPAPPISSGGSCSLVEEFGGHFLALAPEDLLGSVLAMIRWTPEETLAAIYGKGLIADAHRRAPPPEDQDAEGVLPDE